MAYIPDPTDPSQPTGGVIAQTAAAEFRALKGYIQTFTSIVQAMSSGDHSARIAISGGGLIATLLAPTTANYAMARAAYAKSSGKWYWEVTSGIIGGVQPIIGIATIAASLDSYVGSDTFGYGYGGATGQQFYNGVATALGANFTVGDIIGLAFDADANTLQVFKNNVSQGTISGITAGAYYPAISLTTAGDKVTVTFDEQGLTYTPPAGFSAYYNSADVARAAVSVRQCVIAGVVDSNGAASFLSAGTGLAINLLGTTSLVATIASSFSSNGAVDSVVSITGTQNDFYAALAPSNRSYLGLNSAGGAYKTLAPVQYGQVYNKVKQNVLQFNGAVGSTTFLDDFGNTFIAVGGAKVQTNQFKFGTGGLGGGGASNILNGTTDNIRSTLSNAFADSWSIRGWAYCTTLPTAGNVQDIVGTSKSGSSNTDGIRIGIYNNAGTIKFASFVSGDGTTNNILNAVVGTTTPVINTWYYVELTYDAVAGAYRIYINGVQESTTASAARACNYTAMCIGSSCAAGQFFTGYLDKIEVLPYCDHPAGTTYTVPTAAPDMTIDGYSSLWFDTNNYQMYRPTAPSTVAATNPTLTAEQLVMIGETVTGAAAPSTMTSYAFNGKFDGAWVTPLPATNTAITINSNIGNSQYDALIELKNETTQVGYNPGVILQPVSTAVGSGIFTGFMFQKSGTTTVTRTGTDTAFVIVNATNGTYTGATSASWSYRLKAKRSF